MKKVLTTLFLISLLTVLLAPMVVSAQVPRECCTLKRAITLDAVTCGAGTVAAPTAAAAGECPGTYCAASAPKWGMFCLINTIYSITDWIFVILIALAALFIIIGAATLLTAAGAPEKVTSGRNYIMYAAIGLAVAFFARAIPAIVRMIVGM